MRLLRHRPRRDPERLDRRRVGDQEVFGYDPAWRQLTPGRAAEIESLVGPPAGVGEPGPEGGPVAGDEADTGEHQQELAGASGGAGMAAGGD